MLRAPSVVLQIKSNLKDKRSKPEPEQRQNQWQSNPQGEQQATSHQPVRASLSLLLRRAEAKAEPCTVTRCDASISTSLTQTKPKAETTAIRSWGRLLCLLPRLRLLAARPEQLAQPVLGLPLLPLLLLLLPQRCQQLGSLLLECRHKAVVQAAPARHSRGQAHPLSQCAHQDKAQSFLSPARRLTRICTHPWDTRTCPVGRTRTPAPRARA